MGLAAAVLSELLPNATPVIRSAIQFGVDLLTESETEAEAELVSMRGNKPLADDLPNVQPTSGKHMLAAYVSYSMTESSYYREQALRARRLANAITDQYARIKLEELAADYSDIAEDLERGAADIRHRELLPESSGCR